MLDRIAKDVINLETVKVTAISAATGLPVGIAMAATVPVDLAQFYAFILRTAKELAYIYGFGDIFFELSENDAGTEPLQQKVRLIIMLAKAAGGSNSALSAFSSFILLVKLLRT